MRERSNLRLDLRSRNNPLAAALLRWTLILGAGLIVSLSPGVQVLAEPPLLRIEEAELHMGTAFQIALYTADEPAAPRALGAAFARVESLNAKLSDYDPESELSRLSRASPTAEPVPLSPDLFRVLAAAQEVSRRSAGAFDVTVGPFSRLWRRARRQKKMPSQERLEEARQSVGFEHLVLDPTQFTARLQRPAMRLDLGGIAKGFAADEALRILRDRGFPQALVNAGGDVVVGDPPPGSSGWTIGIAAIDPDGEPAEEITLRNAAVATSGDTWQYVELDGRRYSHLLDPRTGLGVTRRSVVTVIAADGMTADSYASAFSVMQLAASLELAEKSDGVAVRIAIRNESDGTVVQHRSIRWDARFTDESAESR